jgi:hypothetical protein
VDQVLDYTDQTLLHPLGLAALVTAAVMLLALPRRWAPLPMIALACFVSPAQRVALFELDFDLLRIMVVVGWLRVLLHAEFRDLRWRSVDTVVIVWALAGTAAFTVLHGSNEALVNRLGMMFDAVGMYFLFRCLIRDWRDFETLTMGFAFVSLPVAAAFTVEFVTGYNPFSIFGRVPEFTEIRHGRLRCQGPFPHPIIAGCFWIVATAIICGGWWSRRVPRGLVAVSVVACLWIVFTTASSTPVGSLMAALVAAAVFPFRYSMRAVRWSILGVLVVLHLVMRGPVWSLFAKMDVVAGSTGWHRYNLIDKAIDNVGDWWLIGTQSTAHWGFWLHDVTNQYILEGVRGGMLTMLLFITILGLAYRHVGQMIKGSRDNRRRQAMAWALGVALFIHTINFFGVSYFGQIMMIWYLTLGACTSLAAPYALADERRPEPRRRGVRGARPADAQASQTPQTPSPNPANAG